MDAQDGMLLLWPRKTVRTFYGRARRCAPSVAAQDGVHLLRPRKTVRTWYGCARRCALSQGEGDRAVLASY
eukprot:gene13004-biopygen9750